MGNMYLCHLTFTFFKFLKMVFDTIVSPIIFLLFVFGFDKLFVKILDCHEYRISRLRRKGRLLRKRFLLKEFKGHSFFFCFSFFATGHSYF